MVVFLLTGFFFCFELLCLGDLLFREKEKEKKIATMLASGISFFRFYFKFLFLIFLLFNSQVKFLNWKMIL